MLRRLSNSSFIRAFFAALLIVSHFFMLAPNPVQAAPGPYGREYKNGYFFNKFDNSGDAVFEGGLKVNNVDDFIYAIKARAYNYGGGWSTQDIHGAQFIIQTMRNGGYGFAGPNEVNDWEQRVRYVASYGGINFEDGISFDKNSYYQDDNGDDAFFVKDGGSYVWHPWAYYAGELVGNSITFRDKKGNLLYAIRRACANPVGNPVGLPNFSFNGDSTIDGNDQASGGKYVTGKKLIYGKPGETVTFYHFISNAGPSEATTKYYAWMQPSNSGRYLAPNSGGRPNPGDVTLGGGASQQIDSNNFTIPTNAQPGQRWCQYVGYYPVSANNPGGVDRVDNQACVEVTFQYDLVPTASVSKNVGSPGDEIIPSFTLNNGGDTTSKPSTWAIKELISPPGVSVDTTAPYTDNLGCAQYPQPGIECKDVYVSSGTEVFKPGLTTLTPPDDKARFTIGNYPAGTRICRILAVDPPTQNNTPRNRWSRPACVTIAKYPTVHFIGGDVSVGNPYQSQNATCSLRPGTGNIYTKAISNDNGSIAEYAAFVRGILRFQQSGADGFGTGSRPAISKSNAGQLSFANTESELGKFGSGDCITDYYQKFSGQIAKEASTGEYTFGGGERKHFSGDVTIKASNVTKGSRTLILVDGNVTVDGNIQYADTYTNTSEVPSLAIIATGDITIKANVTRIDGVYSSKKAINTCDSPDGALSTDICKEQLVVNGAILTDKLNLRRTYGADGSNKSQPAEKFNYTTELLFNNVLDDTPRGRIKVVNERDLPPRFETN